MGFYRRSISFCLRSDYHEKLKFIAQSKNMYISGFLFEIISQYIATYEDIHGIILISDENIEKW